MRNPETVLNNLSKHSNLKDYKYQRLYRLLFNKEMFYIAYQRLASNPGNMTAGTDGKTVDGTSLSQFEKLINSLRDESYKPHPAKRKYIPKKNGKTRPLNIPSFEDKLVQEVVRMILEAIYEGYFEFTSHGFRPNRSCHTALECIQSTFTGTKWFVEGDIKGFFDNIDHNVMIAILAERIDDERFLRLIRKFLNAGYFEDWKYNRTYSGTPQGGIVSPILANIYLDKFDKYIREYAQSFDKGKKRKPTKESKRLETKIKMLRKTLKSEEDESRKAELNRQIKEVQEHQLSIPYSDAMDEDFRRIKYVRYADDFLIGVIGNKAECAKIKADITEFMNEKLKLELSDEKTLITNAHDYAQFLGYQIYVRKSNSLRRNSNGQLKRSFNGRVILRLAPEKVAKKLQELKALVIKQVDGKEKWEPFSRGNLISMKEEEIIAKYNAEIRGYYNYYCMANNIAGVGQSFGYVMKYSCLKTIARKHQTSLRKVFDKLRKDKQLVYEYTTKKGFKKSIMLYNDGFAHKSPIKSSDVDNIKGEYTHYLPNPTLADRLINGRCELCDNKASLIMHHVRSMKELDPKKPWDAIMLKMGRKSIALCEECYSKTVNYEK